MRGLGFRGQGLYKVQGCVGPRVPEEVLFTRRLGQPQAVYTDITQRDDVRLGSGESNGKQNRQCDYVGVTTGLNLRIRRNWSRLQRVALIFPSSLLSASWDCGAHLL